MVPAEFVKFKRGLYRSCGIGCFEGMMLEPCLLQTCFHIAGHGFKLCAHTLRGTILLMLVWFKQ